MVVDALHDRRCLAAEGRVGRVCCCSQASAWARTSATCGGCQVGALWINGSDGGTDAAAGTQGAQQADQQNWNLKFEI